MKTIDDDGAGAGTAVDTEYVYDGEHILMAFEDDGDLINRYLHGPVVDMILADEEVTTTSSDGDIHWTLGDNLGSVRDIIDSSGTVENHITYDAYGNITSETDTSVDHIFAYTGRERDEESDLQFNRARFYDPLVGRWASEDPIGFAAGDGNLAGYVRNSVANLLDPSGLQSWAIHLPLAPTYNQAMQTHLRPTRPGPAAPAPAPPVPPPPAAPDPLAFPNVHPGGPSGGTPIRPSGQGQHIAIYGEGENPQFEDYATEEEWQQGYYSNVQRPLTSTLPDGSVSHFTIRNSPISANTWKEILRLARPGAILTIANTSAYTRALWDRLNSLEVYDGFGAIERPSPVRLPTRQSGTGEIQGYTDGEAFSIILKDGSNYVGPNQ